VVHLIHKFSLEDRDLKRDLHDNSDSGFHSDTLSHKDGETGPVGKQALSIGQEAVIGLCWVNQGLFF
jgi:hypothetical protein